MLYLTSTHDLSQHSQFERNFLIESFCIHLRNIITFLYSTEHQKPTDIYAHHYCADIESKISPISESLTSARERCHKEVGHLTTERISDISDPKKSWDRLALAKEIFLLLKLFSEDADKNKLSENVSDFISKSVLSLSQKHPRANGLDSVS